MEHDALSDADLVAQTLAGNREAFGHLYDRYARLVRALVCGVTLDWPMVQDLTQETFLRAYCEPFDRLNQIAYDGETVGPKDSAKILLRWRLEDGRYQVIYGDLRAEAVTAQRLRTLEAK